MQDSRVKEELKTSWIGVRLHKNKMVEWAIHKAKERNAHLLQLTTDKKRPKAVIFYEDLGFKATHEGIKIHF
ncbi:MAG: hypothetical protein WA810_02850 [Maribacter sp.]